MTAKTAFDDAPDYAMARAGKLCEWLDFSKSTLWRKVQDGSFPKPVKLSDRVTAWRLGDVRAWLQSRAQA